MTRRICVIEGDGIGKEVIPAAVEVCGALNIGLEFVPAFAGFDHFRKTGCSFPDPTLEAVRSCDATLFGATSSPLTRVEGYSSPILALRKSLDLFANLRPTYSLPGRFSHPNVDLLIVRENTEGLYAGHERMEGDTAIADRVITRRASERIVRAACEQAQRRRKHLTLVHKANVLRVTDGLFRETALQVTHGFPDLRVDEMLVDAMAMNLVLHPDKFDVIVTTNMFGDILSDAASALVGGLGVAPSGNIGPITAVFEPVHGSAPDIAGKGVANPVGAILSAAMMLDYLGLPDAASQIKSAVLVTLREGTMTADLGGNSTTRQVTTAVIDNLFAPSSES